MLTRSFVGGGGGGGGRGKNGQDFQLYSGFYFAFLAGMEWRWRKGGGGGVGKAKVVDTQFTSLNGQVNTEESLP